MSGGTTSARRRMFACIFFLWWAIFSAWAAATPAWGAPDEFQHAFRAYALVRGEVYVKPEAAFAGTGGFVDVPQGWVASRQSYRCFGHDRTPACMAPVTDDATPVRVSSTAARYNPVYYAIVGIGSLGTTPTDAIYAMRIVSAALGAFFLTWATTSAMRARRPIIATSALLLSCTPMVGFLAGSINPNSLEICAAMSAWVNGVLLFKRTDDRERSFFARRTAISIMAFTATRALSPVWLVVMVTILIIALVQKEHVRWALTSGRKWLIAVVGVVIASVVWTIASHALLLNVQPDQGHHSYIESLQNVWFGGIRLSYLFYGTIGIFGWLDAFQPEIVEQPWVVATGTLAVLALVKSTWRQRIGLLLLLAASVFLPFIIEAKNFNVSGFVWQARYSMPISLGFPLLAGLLLSESDAWTPKITSQRVLAVFFCTVAIWTDIIGFLYAMGHNAVGGERIALSGAWSPPVPTLALVAVQATALIALSTLAIRVTRTIRTPSGYPSRRSREPEPAQISAP